MLDPISDMITRIRNAQKAGKEEVNMPFSNLKMGIANILKEKGFIEQFEKGSEGNNANIKIKLKYNKINTNRKAPAIEEINRISKQGKRVYAGKNSLKKVRNGYGISIVSTSKGVMTGEEARKQGVGGEIICEVY
jgi:small subunit ribosomal protein S8